MPIYPVYSSLFFPFFLSSLLSRAVLYHSRQSELFSLRGQVRSLEQERSDLIQSLDQHKSEVERVTNEMEYIKQKCTEQIKQSETEKKELEQQWTQKYNG